MREMHETRRQSTSAGFTLIEIMIVVAIVAILAGIAIPAFTFYRYKSMSAEVRVLLGSIRVSQESFYGEMDNYANITTTNPPTMPTALKAGWLAQPCPATCDKDNTETCTTFDCIGFETQAVYFRYVAPHLQAIGTTAAEFAIGAQSDLDSDGNPGSWGYRTANYGGTVGAVADGISACPADALAYSIEACTPITF